ncbi:MAG: GNAT family N-acetyltransferase [Alphaproteobacteria bacterium]|nr:GNAT family N-acetyltransferase [Alphaproteobacteria bacterium]
MFIKKFSAIFAFILMGLGASNVHAFLKEEEITNAKILMNSKIEDCIDQPENKKGWLTIEEFPFTYKENARNFWIANTFDFFSKWGHIVICKNSIEGNNKETNLYRTTPSDFSDFNGQRILSHLRYEYVSNPTPYFVLEKVDTDPEFRGNGYSQAAVKYFLDEFISKKTNVNIVFSDCIVNSTRAFFPKYGFTAGMLPNYTVKRVTKFPYYWVRPEEKNSII